jgi:molecular chaperone GrpE
MQENINKEQKIVNQEIIDNKEQEIVNQREENNNQENIIQNEENISQEPMIENVQEEIVPEIHEQDENLLKMQQLEKELTETKEQLLRLAADFDNYKKRTLKEKADIITYANEELIKGILPILDDFERTMKVVHTSGNIEAIKQGLELVAKNLFHNLNKRGVEMIPALNEEFNADLHEAVGSLPVDDENKKNKVIDVIEEGYKFQGKVIRHSKVIIGA